MKLSTLLIPFCFLFFLHENINAQEKKTSGYNTSEYYSNFNPEGPKASGLGSFGNTPINYYTRLPEISIPLLSLSSRDLSVPISLSYDATGVHVDDIAGPVGMKWNLDAGGFVARQMNGLPDEDPNNGYWKYKNELNAASVDVNTWGAAAVQNTRDTEPDEFVINISGRSIRFYLRDNYIVTTVPYQNVVILPTKVDGKLTQFQLITEDGTRYLFGGNSSSVEERLVETLNVSMNFDYYYRNDTYVYHDAYHGDPATSWNTNRIWKSFFYADPSISTTSPVVYQANAQERSQKLYNSKWYLVEITSVTNDKITFSYQKQATKSKYSTSPIITRREPVLKYINAGYSYTDNVCVDAGIFGGCQDHQNRTFTHTDWRTPAFAAYTNGCPDYVPNCTNGYPEGVPQSSTAAYFDPRAYNFVDNYPDAIMTSQSLISESVIKLTGITTSAGNSVAFTTSSREDFPESFKYDQITLSNFNGGTVKTIKLGYSTFGTSGGTNLSMMEWLLLTRMTVTCPSGTGANCNIAAANVKDFGEAAINRMDYSTNPTGLNNLLKKYAYEGLKDYNFKRLCLMNIKEYSNSSETLINGFGYNFGNLLRRRLSPDQSALGFPLNSTTIPISMDLRMPGTTKFFGLVVSPYAPALNKDAASAGNFYILNKIIYPTGGYTSLVFDSSPALTAITDRSSSDAILSSKEIVGQGTPLNLGSPVLTSYENNLYDGTLYQRFKVTTSYPQNRNSIFSHGVRTVYEKVRVYDGSATNHNGYEDFVFRTTSDDNNSIYASPKDKDVNGNEIDFLTVDAFPFPKKQEKDHLRGQLAEHYVFDKSNNLLLFQKNEYTVNPNGFVPSSLKLYTAGSFAYGNTTKYRYARPSITGDWIALTKKTERIYDQQYPNDIAKSSTKITELTYNNYNQAVSQAVVYNEAHPSVKNITKTKYPFEYSYEEVNCGDVVGPCNPTPPASQEVAAMQLMTSQNQLSIPIEVQNLVEDNGTTRLTSATAYLFRTVGTNPVFVKPSMVMGLNTILETTGSNAYQEFSVSPSSGTVITDPHMQVLHNYDSYNTAGNIVQQTTQDGITSSYGWDATNTLVNSSSIGTGSLQQTTTYEHTPGVGLISTTDPNGINASFEYGRFNRLKLTRDKDSNILTRYRYNYAGDAELANSITVTGSQVTGQDLYFASPDNVEFGQTQYEWNFGDGTKITNTGGLNHSYSTAGTYTVTLNKTNPEYTPVTLTKSVVISRVGEVNLTMSGTSFVDNCQYDPNFVQPVLSASLSYGCPGNLTYNWEYRINNGNWSSFGGSAAQVGPPPGFGYCGIIGFYEVQCTITDGCGNAVTSGPNNIGLQVTVSNQSCATAPCTIN